MNLVITGNPGVGKHTIAEFFVKQNSSYQIFDISKFAIEKGFGEKVDDGVEVDTTRLKNEIGKLSFVKSIIVGHLAPYVIDESNIDFAIILRKNPYELMKVYEKRKYQSSKIKENAGSEILGVIANDSIMSFGNEKSFQINATDTTPEMVLEKIHDVINNKKSSDVVDWLELIKEKNEIGKFFDY
tara:strand:- start:383 stop:937 length:555 start_codon:yes stop_codon:yes gene_type:complete